MVPTHSGYRFPSNNLYPSHIVLITLPPPSGGRSPTPVVRWGIVGLTRALFGQTVVPQGGTLNHFWAVR